MKSSCKSVAKSIFPNLRNGGVKIRVRHERYVRVWNKDTLFELTPVARSSRPQVGALIAPHGGRTTVELLFPDGQTYKGVATCSMEDRFDRLEGLRIATQRALQAQKVRAFERKDEELSWTV